MSAARGRTEPARSRPGRLRAVLLTAFPGVRGMAVRMTLGKPRPA